eukprot:gene2948-2156_t
METEVASQFEKALDAAAEQSRANLERIAQQRQRQQAVLTQHQRANGGSSSVYFAETRQTAVEAPRRSNSAPRLLPAGRSAAVPSSSSVSSAAPSSSSVATASVAAIPSGAPAAVNANVIRKFQLLEERFKKLEKAQLSTEHVVQDAVGKLDQLSEAQKLDKKAQHALREQLASTRTRMDLLANQDELKQRPPPQTTPFGIDSEALQELIQQKVQRAVEDALIQQRLLLQPSAGHSGAASPQRGSSTNPAASALASSHGHSQSHSGGHNGAGAAAPATQQNRFVVDSLAKVERELLRLSSEMERVRSKQTYLDRVYTEIKDASNAKELRREDAHRKQLQHYRADLDQQLERATQRLNDLQAVREQQAEDIRALQKAMDDHVHGVSGIFAEFDVRHLDAERQLQTVANAHALLQQKTQLLTDQVAELDETLPKIVLQDLAQHVQPLQQAVDRLAQRGDLLHDQVLESSVALAQLSERCDALAAGPVALLTTSLDQLQTQLQTQETQWREALAQETRTTDEGLRHVTQNLKKWKARVTAQLARTEALEAKHVELQALADALAAQRDEEAQTTYAVHTKLQRLDDAAAAMAAEHAQHFDRVHRLVDETLADIQRALQQSHDAQTQALAASEAQARAACDATLATVEARVPTLLTTALPAAAAFAALATRVQQQDEVQQTLLEELQGFQRHMQQLVTRQQQRAADDDAARAEALESLRDALRDESQAALEALRTTQTAQWQADVAAALQRARDDAAAAGGAVAAARDAAARRSSTRWRCAATRCGSPSTRRRPNAPLNAKPKRSATRRCRRSRSRRSRSRRGEQRAADEAERQRVLSEQARQRRRPRANATRRAAAAARRCCSRRAVARRVAAAAVAVVFVVVGGAAFASSVASLPPRRCTRRSPRRSARRSARCGGRRRGGVAVVAARVASRRDAQRRPPLARRAPATAARGSEQRQRQRQRREPPPTAQRQATLATTRRVAEASQSETLRLVRRRRRADAAKKATKKATEEGDDEGDEEAQATVEGASRRSHRRRSDSDSDSDSDATSDATGDSDAASTTSAASAARGRSDGRAQSQRSLAQPAAQPTTQPQRAARYEASPATSRHRSRSASRSRDASSFSDAADDVDEGDEDAALDDWDHIELASSLASPLAASAATAATFAPIASPPAPASQLQSPSPSQSQRAPPPEDGDFDPQQMMQLVIEKRRQLRSQLRPELFGTQSSRIIHRLPQSQRSQQSQRSAASSRASQQSSASRR